MMKLFFRSAGEFSDYDLDDEEDMPEEFEGMKLAFEG